MPPLETETAQEAYERGRFESRVSSQELSGLCSMIKRLMTDRLRQREPRVGAAAAALAALVRQQPVAPRVGAAAAAVLPGQLVAPRVGAAAAAALPGQPVAPRVGAAAAAAAAALPGQPVAPRVGAAAAAVLPGQPVAPRVGAAAAAALPGQPVAPQPVIAQPEEPEDVAPPQEEPESSSSSSPPQPEGKARGGPGRSRRFNLRLIGIPEAEDKANEAQAILEQLLAENFPELQNGASLQIEKAHRVPSRFDEKKATPRHILVTFLHLSDKEKVVRLSRQRKEVTFQGVAVRLASDFSPQVLQARRQWSSVYRVLQEKECQPRILYPARLSFVYQGKRKTFLDMQALKKFVAQVPSLGNLLRDVLLPVENEPSKE